MSAKKIGILLEFNHEDPENISYKHSKCQHCLKTFDGADAVHQALCPDHPDKYLWYPYYRLKEEGHETFTIGPEKGKVYNSKHGYPCKADYGFDDIKHEDLDALIIPGGFAPDYLRRDKRVLDLVRGVTESGRKTWHYLTQGYRKEEFKNMSRSNAEFTFSMPVLVTCKFDEELIKMKPLSCPHFLQYMSKLNKFDAQGQVTPKPMIRSGRESNLSKILCLFSSPASCLPI